MQKRIKIKKPFAYLIAITLVLTTMTCTSRSVLYTRGPFSRELLNKNNLIVERTYNNLHIRIVYPGAFSDPQQKQLIAEYIQTFPEKQIFDDSINAGINNEILEPNEEHYLAIYGYIMAYRIKIVSLVFQVQYWTDKFKKTERWYTLSYNRNTKAIISFNSLFTDFTVASVELKQYIKQEIIRQNILQNIHKNIDNISFKDTMHNFSFIPSRKYRKKFIGLQIYINTNEKSMDERMPNIINRSYVVNIPYSFIEKYVIKTAKKFFTQEPFMPDSYKYENDISKRHIFVFPDLRDREF